jgi:hypothetical protein
MRQARWRNVAHALAAASLCFAAIGCGDDTGNDMGMDLGPRDMSVAMDMAMDMTMAPGLPSAALIVADVQGTVYTTNPDGGEVAIAAGAAETLTHRVLAVTNFPMASSVPSDFSNLMVNAGTLTISGCVADRYDSTSATGHMVTPDVDVGTITIGAVNKGSVVTTGWESTRFALSSATPTFFSLPFPNSGSCTKGAVSYGCVFGGSGAGTAAGIPMGLGVLPPLPLTNWTALCGGAGATACIANCDQTGHAGLCEQRMFYTATTDVDAGAVGTTIGVDVPGGMPYSAATKSIPIPPGPYITSITVGTTAVACATSPCTMNDLVGHFDATQDLHISFSCDPNNQTTTGAGCDVLTPFDLFTLLGTTSQHARDSFAAGDPKFGTLNCLEQTKKSDHTVTVPAAAWAAMVNGQTGGAINLNFLRVKGSLAQLNPNQLYSAGTGQSVFINLP